MLIGDLDVAVRTLTTGAAVRVPLLATLAGAAKLMTESTIGLVLVHDAEDRTCGVLSERDIVRAVAADADVTDERARDWMSEDVVEVPGGATVRDAAAVLLEAEVRHLVVVDEGAPPGVVSVREVLASAMAADAAERRSLLD